MVVNVSSRRCSIAEGDLVAVDLVGGGTHEGTFQDVRPTGRRWAATCSAFFWVEEGQIVDAWVNWDLLGIHDQLGGVSGAETASV
jgi:predicted ester cyclase